MCRTAHAVISVVICGIQMLVRVLMTFILMLENVFRLVLQTLYNFISFLLQMASLIPICLVFLLTTRLKCFMCGGGGPCPINRGGGCDCLMSAAAIILVFFIFRAVGLMDKIFYKIGYVQAPMEVDKFVPTPGDVRECSRDGGKVLRVSDEENNTIPIITIGFSTYETEDTSEPITTTWYTEFTTSSDGIVYETDIYYSNDIATNISGTKGTPTRFDTSTNYIRRRLSENSTAIDSNSPILASIVDVITESNEITETSTVIATQPNNIIIFYPPTTSVHTTNISIDSSDISNDTELAGHFTDTGSTDSDNEDDGSSYGTEVYFREIEPKGDRTDNERSKEASLISYAPRVQNRRDLRRIKKDRMRTTNVIVTSQDKTFETTFTETQSEMEGINDSETKTHTIERSGMQTFLEILKYSSSTVAF